ncbi:CIC11C00000000746 [Sungouiella intermedia]|uniref:Protoheme IX farnesyltransferase, mitochondrial n=1 Tax=Sungouiella intermedia TaxID=45354 RepID=A0A1L0D6N1_9ASCO|nr:CIC11C00000000746 [[Candida] intermedia]
MNDVARKVLSCQEPNNKIGRSPDTADPNSNIPFQVTPKSVANKNSEKKQSSQSILRSYFKLTKPNLTFLVTLSSICSYAISPNSVSVGELAFLTIGTALCSGSANAINMGREPEFDKRMTRTSLRPVVTGLITPKQAFQFASVTGSLGCLILYFGVNPIVSLLGFINIGLYAWVYTSLKRRSILNTWVGALVGAIPPLMGWAASSSLAHPGSWCLAALLYAWQFPHFNALSHNIADQYKQAGYVMTAAENPKLNARVALRYSLLMFPICFGLSYFEVTDWFFQIDSGIANTWMAILAYRFWMQQKHNHASGHTATPDAKQMANFHARKLFWCSVWQLPVVLVLAMLHKKGQWDRLWHYMGLNSEYSDPKQTKLAI